MSSERGYNGRQLLRTKQKSSKVQSFEKDKHVSSKIRGVDRQKQQKRNTKLSKGFQTLDEKNKT
jgi:hypothetical protein